MPYSAVAAKADRATTLSGYGITNAYTKSEVDTALNSKINEPSADGSDGQALLTDGNGNRYWGSVGADYIKSVETSQLNVNSSGKLSLASAVSTKLGYVDVSGSIATALNSKANASTTYTKTEVDTALSDKADADDLDTWHTWAFTEATLTSEYKLAFSNVDDSDYGYKLFCDAPNAYIKNIIVENSSYEGKKHLVYVMGGDGLLVGTTKGKLRVIK